MERRNMSETSKEAVRILLYSDNSHLRTDVMNSVGSRVRGMPIEWTESATYQGAMLKVRENTFDLLILDAETPKLGGIGFGKYVRDEIDEEMPYIILVGRPQDRWLARVAKPQVVLDYPSNPRDLAAAVRQVVDTNVFASTDMPEHIEA